MKTADFLLYAKIGDDDVRRYNVERLKNVAMLVGGITAGGSMALATIALFAGGNGDAWFALGICACIGLLVFVVLLLPVIPFAQMIHRQERAGLQMDAEVREVERGLVGTYLGESWLIHAGHVALHHSRIRRISARHTGRGTASSMWYICVETVEGKNYRWVMGSGQIRKVKAWLKAHQDPQQTR